MAQADVDAPREAVVVDDVVDLAAVAVEFFAVGGLRFPILGRDVFALPVEEVDAFRFVVDGVQFLFNPLPALEDPAGIRTEGDYVAEGFEFAGFVDEDYTVTFAVAFNGRGEAGESGADAELGEDRIR